VARARPVKLKRELARADDFHRWRRDERARLFDISGFISKRWPRRKNGTLLPHHCRWIAGEIDDEDTVYCGADTATDSSYCAHHLALSLWDPDKPEPIFDIVAANAAYLLSRGIKTAWTPKPRTDAQKAATKAIVAEDMGSPQAVPAETGLQGLRWARHAPHECRCPPPRDR
jgi:hypothetical protein